MSYFDLTLFGFNVQLGMSPLLVALVTLLLVLYIRSIKGLPPFPATPIPIWGDLLFRGKDPLAMFRRWRKNHGDIFSVLFGSKPTVILNGYDVMKEAVVKYGDVFNDRPNVPFFTHVFGGKGIIASSGATWKSQRKFCLTALREFGFGRNSMEDGIHQEVKHLLKFYASKTEEKQDLSEIHIATSNVICTIVFGHSFKYDDAHFKSCLDVMHDASAEVFKLNLFNSFPYILNIPGVSNLTSNVFKNIERFDKTLIEPEIERHLNEYDGTTPDFVAAYIKEIKERESAGVDETELKETLVLTVKEFFVAGTETTSVTLKWMVQYLIRFPEIQERCFQEIKENIGFDRLPTMKDKPVLPYVEAVIAETLRIANIAPFGILHSTSQDTEFRGYSIPKGTPVLLNMDSVLMDPEQWPEPELFRPERFLDGSGVFSKPESFIPFSIGRRVCLGENLAKMELFLFSAALIQTFKLVFPDDERMPSTEPYMAVVSCPQPFKVNFVQRDTAIPELYM